MILQDKHADTDGAARFTAPSVVFERDGQRLVAGGWQSFDVYDVMVANLGPDLERRETPEPADLLPLFPHGLTTQEVAVACTANLKETDREGTLRKLVALAADGKRAAPISATTRSGFRLDLTVTGRRPLPTVSRTALGRHTATTITTSAAAISTRRPGERRAMPCASSWRAATASGRRAAVPPAPANTVTRTPRPSEPPSWCATFTRPGGRAGVVLARPRQPGRGQRHEGGAHADAEQQHREREAGEVGRVGRQLAEPEHAGQGERDAAGQQRAVADALGAAAARRAATRTSPPSSAGTRGRPASALKPQHALQELRDEEEHAEHRRRRAARGRRRRRSARGSRTAAAA